MVVATYFIVGGLIMYFMRGARGVEVIPNYTFWKDLPALIKVSLGKLGRVWREGGREGGEGGEERKDGGRGG